MSDIFLSYARKDKERAHMFADALNKQGLSVWWDPNIDSGEIFQKIVQKELDAAKCVIVLWSKESVDSKWVNAEALKGDERKIHTGRSLECKSDNTEWISQF